MNPVILPGDRVSIEKTTRGYFRGRYLATVLNWTLSGNLRVKLDESGMVKVVLPQRVRKIADGPTQPPEG